MSQNVTLSRFLSLPLIFIVALVTTGVQAADPTPAPIQLALVNPLQVVDSGRSVRGFRYSLFWGLNQDVSGLDISTMASSASGNVRGWQWALLFSQVDGNVKGLQISGVSIASQGLTGLQVGFLGTAIYEGPMRGVQLGALAGSFSQEMKGIQGSIIATNTKQGRGVQIAGVLNGAEDMSGIQVAGLLNVADDMKGLQLGLLNFNKNGFLPFFPLFNFGL